jgi:hypothetical protein
VILCSDFNALDANDDQGIHMAAAHLVDLLNGALFLDDPSRRPLSVGAVHRRHANGQYGVSIAIPAVSVTLRGVSAVGSAAGEETPHDAISWLRKGMDDDRVSDVLAYMRADPGWGAVRNAVGIRVGEFAGNMKVSFQATRSIG